jgi:hypothetical protein
MRLCAVSVDLDEVGEYRGLHGAPARDVGAHAVYDCALPRLSAFARAQRLPLTLFAIGRDLTRDRSASALRALSNEHVVENHSFGHRYDLVRAPAAAVTAEIVEGAAAIEAVTDRRPEGFRAPGYTTSAALFDALRAAGVRFDASLFPCPAYYLAKLGALTRLGLRGRDSRAIVGSPAVMLARSEPHRLGSLWELPIAVTRRLRLPFIGTALTLAGKVGARWLARGCIGRSLVSLELHGIDFLDAGDGLDDLVGLQPDVRIASGDKQQSIAAAIGVLRHAGYRFVTLSAACDILNGQHSV